MLRSLYRLGFHWEAVEYFGFIEEAVTGGDLNRPFELQVSTASAGSAT
jgi:hypothetical protein